VTSFFKVLGSLLAPLLLSSCEYFADEYTAENHVFFVIEKNDRAGCVTSLYADDEYIARVNVKSCTIYLHTTTKREN
jgi:hypothetical protein